ncbi:polar growth protein [Clarireedia jacksonii]
MEPQALRPDAVRPEPGAILIVIHDFSARSSDELSLSKGDRVELIERDDEFGDGWYLGRSLVNGSSGLFPEVYTRLAPRPSPSYHNIAPIPISPSDPVLVPAAQQQSLPTMAQGQNGSEPATAVTSVEPPQVIPNILSSGSKSSPMAAAETATIAPEELIQQPLTAASISSAAKVHAHGQDSPVMNETLSVIDEHITDMNHSVVSAPRTINDSGSEYSSHHDARMSYINGEETDEEEEDAHTLEEVTAWSPEQVAEYLFTVGVEKKHCEVFRDQEIAGDVLLGMDQTTVFLKEFELGSVGRRLKTWQKIKALQDEVNGETPTRRNTGTYGSEIGSEDGARRSISAASPTMLPRNLSLNNGPGSQHKVRQPQGNTSRKNSTTSSSPISPRTPYDSHRAAPEPRPSAASIRDLHHSRQSSVGEFATASLMSAVAGDRILPVAGDTVSHKKQASFDKTWTLGAATSAMSNRRMSSTRPLSSGRSLSSAGLPDTKGSPDQASSNPASPKNLDSLDRGYFSGGEVDGRQRNVLRKRGSTATHSRNSSYTDEQRLRTATAHSRHSRFGSVGSITETTPPSAAQKYYGLSTNGRRRTPSESSINSPPRPVPPPKDDLPIVTRLQVEKSYESLNSPSSPKSASLRQPSKADWLLPIKPASQSRHFGLRAISDAVTGHEKSRVTSPDTLASSNKESPLHSPSRTGSSTASARPSLDLDSHDGKTAMTTPKSSQTSRKKSKKETSAYTRGLEKKTPQEQMVDADYSGWMKKKSSNLMTTWKPRLFILKGRRLSYYYSETDDQEKGLIDISFHRVLPADNDRLTGLHATLTGATNSPTSPINAQETIASAEAGAEPESSLSKSGGDQMFIFKLVPPRAGLSRAVNFTKPTVHYFAVPNIKQGRLWMAALMKATIDRDDSKAVTTTYQQKTISLAKARQMRHRPPALMNLDEKVEEEVMKTPASDKHGLNIQGIIFDREPHEGDSGVSGVSKRESGNTTSESGTLKQDRLPDPQSA